MTENFILLTWLPYVLGGVLLISFIVLLIALRHARDGTEDENGFHRR